MASSWSEYKSDFKIAWSIKHMLYWWNQEMYGRTKNKQTNAMAFSAQAKYYTGWIKYTESSAITQKYAIILSGRMEFFLIYSEANRF
jgi:hypothetical protein